MMTMRESPFKGFVLEGTLRKKNLLIQIGLQIRLASRMMQVIDWITSGRKEKIDIKGVNAESV
jgi:hypothetical protein